MAVSPPTKSQQASASVNSIVVSVFILLPHDRGLIALQWLSMAIGERAGD
jgi:hypothetical protein